MRHVKKVDGTRGHCGRIPHVGQQAEGSICRSAAGKDERNSRYAAVKVQ